MFEVHSSVVRRHKGDIVDCVLLGPDSRWVLRRGGCSHDVELVGEDGRQNVDVAIKYGVVIVTI